MTPKNTPEHSRAFVSDNWSGVHPEVLEAIADANIGHAPAYGGDAWTTEFRELARELFGPDSEAFPVLNGTGANVLALQAAIPRWGAVICATTAHINVDETGAPEKTGGIKLLTLPTPDGKLTPEIVAREAWGWDSPHRAAPLAVSIAQVTELGTCYTPDEIAALAEQAHANGMLLHIDGSRLGNAAAFLGTSLAAISSEVGADLLSLGATKNGALGAEAVIVLRPGATPGIEHLRKINLQLASKMRFAAAQLTALYRPQPAGAAAEPLWLRSARHANAMAARLGRGIDALSAEGHPARVEYPVESNAVFVRLPKDVAAKAERAFAFSSWPVGEGLYRFMCSFDTSESDVDALIAALRG